MRSVLTFLISQFILLPLITGLIRFNRIGPSYRPFFWLLITGFITEVVSFIMIKRFHHSNAVPTNIFVLAEWLLIAWQFARWGSMHNRKTLFYGLVAMVCSIWITENLVLWRIGSFSPYFRFFYSFVIVMLSTSKINFMITHDTRNLFRNPRFLICIGFVMYFLYQIVYEWAYQSSQFSETGVTTTIISLFAYINAITNIIFAIAFLLMPAHKKFNIG